MDGLKYVHGLQGDRQRADSVYGFVSWQGDLRGQVQEPEEVLGWEVVWLELGD
jgi:hypothetical protein